MVETVHNWDVQLDRQQLKGRTFLLGNKRAFSLSLPAALGRSNTESHPHKWFGAYLYGRKFLEGQSVRFRTDHEYALNLRYQTAFGMSATGARRQYDCDGTICSEEYFVPDGLQAIACTLTGDGQFKVEPEFDMRFYRALTATTAAYESVIHERSAVVSHPLPAGIYDDQTETFLPAGEGSVEATLWAAVEVVGDEARCQSLTMSRRSRRKRYRTDRLRRNAIAGTAPADALHDHAPLWNYSDSAVYTPVTLSFKGHGTILYGFGSSEDEAQAQVRELRDNLLAFHVQKSETMHEIAMRAYFETGADQVDRAYNQVLARFMDALVARHAVAADTALDRPASMILAGNGYFHDAWKRDENIALGSMLKLGFYDLARQVIDSTWQLQDSRTGRLPQRIRAGEDPPYHSSDGTLWALLRLHEYWQCTGDSSLLYDKLPLVKYFFQCSLGRTRYGMLPSGRTVDPDYLWETWMDTPHTPRDGFPVEIQMLWIACLRRFRPIVQPGAPELESQMAAAETQAWQALARFHMEEGLADGLDMQGDRRDWITPNPYFCFGVQLDLGLDIERIMRRMGRTQLAGQQGIRTLAPQHWERVFSQEFLADKRRVRGHHMRSVGKYNYHRGVEWNWLTQFFVEAELKYGDADSAYKTYLRSQVEAVLKQAGIGGISELCDFSGTRGPEFQAWSMAGFLHAVQSFAGVSVNVPEQRVHIEPQLPESWPYLKMRKWYGSTPFDIEYSATEETYSLQVTWPWGAPEGVSIDLCALLPTRRRIQSTEVIVDDLPHHAVFQQCAVPGSDVFRSSITVHVERSVRIVLQSRRGFTRIAVPA